MAAFTAGPGVRRLGWFAAVALVTVALLAPGAVSGTDGNNGTVKIHEGGSEEEPIVANDPHVCTFHLHFFFADPEQDGDWEIQEWAPDDKGEVVLDGDYDTHGDGEDREPATGVHTLPEGHYKLFWDGDTDKHDKHKVFWVDCDETTTTTTSTGTGGVSGTTSTTSTETTSTDTVSVSSSTSTTSTGTGSVSGTTSTNTSTSGTVSGTTGTGTITLPPTSTVDPAGGSNSTLISFGLLLLAVGALAFGLACPLPAPMLTRRLAPTPRQRWRPGSHPPGPLHVRHPGLTR